MESVSELVKFVETLMKMIMETSNKDRYIQTIMEMGDSSQ